MGNENGSGNGSHGGVNWTVVITILSVVLVLAVVGPLTWKLIVQANEDDMRVVGIILIVLVIFAVFVLALMGGMWAFSQMALRFLQQDDADERRKALQLSAQLTRTAESALRGQSSALSEREQATQAFQQAWGRQSAMVSDGDGGYHEGIGQDVELG
jgi:hypothetical protein